MHNKRTLLRRCHPCSLFDHLSLMNSEYKLSTFLNTLQNKHPVFSGIRTKYPLRRTVNMLQNIYWIYDMLDFALLLRDVS